MRAFDLSWLSRNKRLVLAILGVVQLLSAFACLHFYQGQGYLPLPFFFDKHDTLMDFFHPAFWSLQDGRYSIWGSVYPPLNFLLLKWVCWLFVGGQNFIDAFALRQAALPLAVAVVLVYALAPLAVIDSSAWSRFSCYEKIAAYLIFILSAPFLFAVERGNLIVLTLFLLPFLLSTSPRSRRISLALLINLKPYFIVLLLGYIIKKDWKELLATTFLTGAFYLISCMLLGSDPLAMIMNIVNTAQQPHPYAVKEVLAMPSSLAALSYVFDSDVFQHSGWNKLPVDAASLGILIQIIKWCMIAAALAALNKARNSLTAEQIFAGVLLIIPNLGIAVGGYTMIIYLAIVPVLASMRLWLVYFALLAAIAMPWDMWVIMRDQAAPQISYLSNTPVDVPWMLGAGSFMRPVCNLILLMTVTWELWRCPSGSRAGVTV